MSEITFDVEPCAETGGYVARWDAPRGGGITTQGDSFAELDTMISDAITVYFKAGERPKRIRLHFSKGLAWKNKTPPKIREKLTEAAREKISQGDRGNISKILSTLN